jgi:hypothetical protein
MRVNPLPLYLPLSFLFLFRSKAIVTDSYFLFLIKAKFIPALNNPFSCLPFRLRKFNFDGFVRSQKSGHSCKSRSPELLELTGFPLSRERQKGTKWTL